MDRQWARGGSSMATYAHRSRNHSLICLHYDDFEVHAILGIRAWPHPFGGRADSQDRMDRETSWQTKVKEG